MSHVIYRQPYNSSSGCGLTGTLFCVFLFRDAAIESYLCEISSTVQQREYLDGQRGPQWAAHPSRQPLSSAKSWEEARHVGGAGGRARGAQHVHGYKRVQFGWSGKASDTCWMEEMVAGRGTRLHRGVGGQLSQSGQAPLGGKTDMARVTAGPKRPHLGVCPGLNVPLMSILVRREGNGTPLKYSCLENPMDRGAW